MIEFPPDIDLPPAFLAILQSEGRPLSEMNPGSPEIGLPPPAALRAVATLSGSGIAVFGGDVLSEASGCLNYTYVSWARDPLSGETSEAYSDRSLSEAAAFIREAQSMNRDEIYIVLVCNSAAWATERPA